MTRDSASTTPTHSILRDKVNSGVIDASTAHAIGELVDAFWASEEIVILTGAGISVASGIAPFRKSSDAVWERNVTELATRRFFDESPVQSWLWYLKRFGSLRDKAPNPAHDAIRQLELWAEANGKSLTLVTQNVDDLHRKAGSVDAIEVHGSSRLSRCVKHGCENAAPRGVIPLSELNLDILIESESHDDLPRCPACNSLVRPHILWFDEYYTEHERYQFERVSAVFRDADLFLCSGTSFSVGVTASAIYESTHRGVDMWSVDPSPDPELDGLISWVESPSELSLPLLASCLLNQ